MASKDTEVELERLLVDDDDNAEKPLPRQHTNTGFFFKAYVIISMTILWTGYTLMVRYTRSTTPAAEVQ
uniref:Uncharacterized protein n=1 Tax=Panagrolaimus sp. PS1159 TaxID=55785 RepID=A0AC35GFP7_9BILA